MRGDTPDRLPCIGRQHQFDEGERGHEPIVETQQAVFPRLQQLGLEQIAEHRGEHRSIDHLAGTHPMQQGQPLRKQMA